MTIYKRPKDDDFQRQESSASLSPAPSLSSLKEKSPSLRTMVRQTTNIRSLIESETTSPRQVIRRVCLIVVVDAEIRPIMEKYKFKLNEELTAKFLNLGKISSGQVQNLHLDIVKVAESKLFERHYSGYTQAAALAALVSTIIRPDIVISFGTAGGITEEARSGDYGFTRCEKADQNINAQQKLASLADSVVDEEKQNEKDKASQVQTVKIGDVVLGKACLFMDRLRTRNKNAFDWGVWGGGCMQTNVMAKEVGLVEGVLGSQIGYIVTPFQVELCNNAHIIALDMECAPIAQILNQTGVAFLALKVISNGIYPGKPERMEAEYHENREMVSKKATEVLSKVIEFLNGRCNNAL